MNDESPVLERLMAVIESRKANPSERSYTCSLFRGGVEKIGGKILEEAQEVLDAVRCSDQQSESKRQSLIHEAADLMYHLLVMLGYHGVSFREVEAELAGRLGVSGFEEKASRRPLTE